MMLQGIFPDPLLPWQETQAPNFPAATTQPNGENEHANGKRSIVSFNFRLFSPFQIPKYNVKCSYYNIFDNSS